MKKVFVFFIALIMGLFFSSAVLAASPIEALKDMPVRSDFVVGPGKAEFLVDPGETITKEITVTSRRGKEQKFQIILEDFVGTKDGSSNAVLLGLAKGPYSVKDYIKPEVSEFTLQHGDRITIPVQITIPKDAVPGGLYGALVVETKDDPNSPEIDPKTVKSGIQIKSRIAILFFVRVRGEANEDGYLKSFTSDKKLYFNPSVNLSYSFENKGNVYLNPYGYIEIKNMYGSLVNRINIDPYYVLPDALRISQFNWSKGFMLGRYTAKITLAQGYLDRKSGPDTKTIAFWVIPWKFILIFIIGLIVILAIIRGIALWFKKNFQRRK